MAAKKTPEQELMGMVTATVGAIAHGLVPAQRYKDEMDGLRSALDAARIAAELGASDVTDELLKRARETLQLTPAEPPGVVEERAQA